MQQNPEFLEQLQQGVNEKLLSNYVTFKRTSHPSILALTYFIDQVESKEQGVYLEDFMNIRILESESTDPELYHDLQIYRTQVYANLVNLVDYLNQSGWQVKDYDTCRAVIEIAKAYSQLYTKYQASKKIFAWQVDSPAFSLTEDYALVLEFLQAWGSSRAEEFCLYTEYSGQPKHYMRFLHRLFLALAQVPESEYTHPRVLTFAQGAFYYLVLHTVLGHLLGAELCAAVHSYNASLPLRPFNVALERLDDFAEALITTTIVFDEREQVDFLNELAVQLLASGRSREEFIKQNYEQLQIQSQEFGELLTAQLQVSALELRQEADTYASLLGAYQAESRKKSWQVNF
ncbi:hypothetical protein [Psittacicella gerlachiana]|uniref:Uncharacterized protein n=1 Tax=Psittacicella gerlachiana TaxID=2028574 RepID=A0A3A1YDS1_9GAMM|nr:hypothetical protein [Psittacicella gerlachiana]RIY34277.1 hypothetical protein CKF59_05705 [Psittacicella gerlachiana]